MIDVIILILIDVVITLLMSLCIWRAIDKIGDIVDMIMNKTK